MTPTARTFPKAYLTRRYRLSASHRLHSDALSPQQNRATYGKCDNPHGHGTTTSSKLHLAARSTPQPEWSATSPNWMHSHKQISSGASIT